MGTIVSYIAYVLGFLMDFFFRGLTLIGYPRLWACIVLFAVVTRFLFLPQKIGDHKNKLLMPVVNRELLAADPTFFEKTKDPELTVERAALKREVYKKYKVSNKPGCLTSLIQLPLLAALFYVVKNPQEFIPSFEALSSASPEVNSLFGVSLAAVPWSNLTASTHGAFLLLVPVVVMLFTILKMSPSLRLAKKASDKVKKFKAYGLCLFFTLLIGWFSASLPLAISLYWIATDVTLYVFDLVIGKCLAKNKFISNTLEEHCEVIRKLNEEKAAAAAVEAASAESEEPHDVDLSASESAEEPCAAPV